MSIELPNGRIVEGFTSLAEVRKFLQLKAHNADTGLVYDQHNEACAVWAVIDGSVQTVGML
jgi:hypothetical protein